MLMQPIIFTELKSKTLPHPVINCGQIVSLSLRSAAYFQFLINKMDELFTSALVATLMII